MDALELSKKMRRSILEMTHGARASHVGSCLSVVDILAVLYSDEFFAGSYSKLEEFENVVILSKGHAVAALYAALASVGALPKSELQDYCRDGSRLGGHPSHSVPGVTLSTGSLGHGLPFGAGVALGKKINSKPGRVFVVMSDGEMDEGTTWESLLFAQHYNLNNLTVILDRNGLQSLDSTEETMRLEPLFNKISAFNWVVKNINGHNPREIADTLRLTFNKPSFLIANTVKGYGVSFMEHQVAWHYKSPSESELNDALNDLESRGL